MLLNRLNSLVFSIAENLHYPNTN